MPFQPPTEPKKSFRAVMVFTLRHPNFLRPLRKIFLAGERNGNTQITYHFPPQVWALPDAKRRPKQNMVVATFSKPQVDMERWALPVVLLILRRSTGITVFKLGGEIERLPECHVIPLCQRLIQQVLAQRKMIGN